MKNGPSPPFSQVSAAVRYTQWTYPTGFRSRTEDGFTVSPVFNGFVLESMERLNSESFVGKKKRSYAFPRTKFHEHRLVPSRDYHGRRNDKRSRDPDADALPESETNGKPQLYRDITATQHCFAKPHAAPAIRRFIFFSKNSRHTATAAGAQPLSRTYRPQIELKEKKHSRAYKPGSVLPPKKGSLCHLSRPAVTRPARQQPTPRHRASNPR